MPTYQYACTECAHAFEQQQKFTDDTLTVCPRCQGRLRKLFNAVGVVFKGSGFYRTDSRATSSAASDSSSGDSSSGDAGSGKEPKKESAKESGGAKKESSTSSSSSSSSATSTAGAS